MVRRARRLDGLELEPLPGDPVAGVEPPRDPDALAHGVPVRAAVVVEVDLDAAPERLDVLEKPRLLGGHRDPEVGRRVIAQPLRLVPVMMGQHDLVHPANADLGKPFQDIARSESHQQRPLARLEDINVAGVIEDIEILAELLERARWPEVAVVSQRVVDRERGQLADGRRTRRARGLAADTGRRRSEDNARGIRIRLRTDPRQNLSANNDCQGGHGREPILALPVTPFPKCPSRRLCNSPDAIQGVDSHLFLRDLRLSPRSSIHTRRP